MSDYISFLTQNQRDHYAKKENGVVPDRDRPPGREEAGRRKGNKLLTLSNAHIRPFIKYRQGSSFVGSIVERDCRPRAHHPTGTYRRPR